MLNKSAEKQWYLPQDTQFTPCVEVWEWLHANALGGSAWSPWFSGIHLREGGRKPQQRRSMIVVWSTFGLGVSVYCMVSQSLVKIWDDGRPTKSFGIWVERRIWVLKSGDGSKPSESVDSLFLLICFFWFESRWRLERGPFFRALGAVGGYQHLDLKMAGAYKWFGAWHELSSHVLGIEIQTGRMSVLHSPSILMAIPRKPSAIGESLPFDDQNIL